MMGGLLRLLLNLASLVTQLSKPILLDFFYRKSSCIETA